jgi:acyl carrier protein
VQEYLAALWEELLGVDRVGAEHDFFGLGGTSLGAMEVMVRLCREFDIDLPLETLFAHRTLAELAGVAEQQILDDVADLGAGDRGRLIEEPERGR